MKTTLAIIQGSEINLFVDPVTNTELVVFTADMDIDCDGVGGNPHHDPYFQADTTYHHNGIALHAETVPYVVVPPIIRQKTRGVVLGALCEVINHATGLKAVAVVGDIGPRAKVGEGSPALAELLGLSGNPNTGGTSDHVIEYRIHVDKPARINGVQYALQPA